MRSRKGQKSVLATSKGPLAVSQQREQLDEAPPRAPSAKLDEALAQQAATNEILQVIKDSPTDVGRVFQSIANSAATLCNALNSSVYRFDGELIHFVAESHFSSAAIEITRRLFPARPERGNATTRAVADCTVVHIPDVLKDPDYRSLEWADAIGLRSVLSVPMVLEGRPIGVITVNRAEPAPFPQCQVELLNTFANQAVIAIENARVMTELSERTRDLHQSLEYQTATSHVLQVTSRSTFDLQPVLETVIQTAGRLCNADMGHIATRDGDFYRPVATFAYSPEHDAWVRNLRLTRNCGTVVGRVAFKREVVHVADLDADPEYVLPDQLTKGRPRTALGVPLLGEGEPSGVIFLARRRVEAFTEQQVELVCRFADQAVIAIENARRINETREALDKQTAMAEILGVIANSPTDVQPTFDAIAAIAVRICGADSGGVFTFEGSQIYVGAYYSEDPAERDSVYRVFPVPPGRGSATGRAILTREVVHIDPVADTEHAHPTLARYGMVLSIPLLRDGDPLGAITVLRHHFAWFTEAQIAILKTFADQAVIAIETVRLFNELRERTSELTQREAELRVTFDNMGDGVVMFDKELRLVAWNCNFQVILDLPDELLADRWTYGDYFAGSPSAGNSAQSTSTPRNAVTPKTSDGNGRSNAHVRMGACSRCATIPCMAAGLC